MNEASPIRIYKIPKKLVGARDKEILNWAREKLLGVEPDLDGRSLRNIKNGNTIEIFLEPKTPGTYLNGEFIPAFDYSPPIGSDLEEAEKQWDLEEELNEWVDGENQKFNKDKWKKSKTSILDLWEHGKRIFEFKEEKKISLSDLYKKLQSRGKIDDYESMKHEFCVIFYEWKKDIQRDDPVFSLNWKKLSHVLMFGKADNSIKDYALRYITSYPLHKLTSPEIALLLQANLQRIEFSNKYTEEEQIKILNVRNKIKSKLPVPIQDLEEIVNIITNKKVDMNNTDTNNIE